MGPLLEFAVRIENLHHSQTSTCSCITDVKFDPDCPDAVVIDPGVCSEALDLPGFFGSGFLCPNYGQGAYDNDQAADNDESEESSEIPEHDSESASSMSPQTEAMYCAFGASLLVPSPTPAPPADDDLQPPAASSGSPQAEP